MKNDIKDIIKRNSLNNVLVYLIVFYTLGGLLFISFIYLMVKDYTTYGIICLLLAIVFIGLGIYLTVRANDSDWDQLTFEIEKDFDMNLLYSDNFLAISNNYILFYNNKSIFKINDVLFYFINNNYLKLYVKDSLNNVYDYNFRYTNSNTFNNIINIIKAKAFDSDILYRDNLLMFSANALYDFNKISGKDVIILRNIKEIIRTNQNEFVLNGTYNDKDITGTYKYNDINMCNQTFNYLCNNCNVSRIYYSLDEYKNK